MTRSKCQFSSPKRTIQMSKFTSILTQNCISHPPPCTLWGGALSEDTHSPIPGDPWAPAGPT